MEQAQQEMASVNLVEELARREQQLEQLRNAYIELQQQTTPNASQVDRIFKNISHLPIFTGTNDITINSFMSSVEYLLSTVDSDELKKEATRAIFYRNIQGEAKNTVINIQQPDNWYMIKKVLKLRYRPDTEPHQIYRRISNLKVNTVSELSIEIQNIKYKSDELIVYYRDDHCIDLSNIDSLLVNTTKEMTQGTLLDKIYDERDLGQIIDIMTRRRFEDSCIRPEFKKFRKEERPAKYYNPNNNNNKNQNYNGQYKGQVSNQQTYPRQNYQQQNYQGQNPQYRQQQYGNNHYNNSGNYRFHNNKGNNNSGNFQRFPQQVGNPRPNLDQNRLNQPRQDRNEPMEIDNMEINQCQTVGHSEPNLCRDYVSKVGQDQNEQDISFRNTASDCLPTITITINGRKYTALIDTGANLSLIDSNINDFERILLKKPIEFSTITKKDVIRFEVITDAPNEFNLPAYTKINWKMTELKGRKYNFIIGIDLLNCFNTMINLIDGYISFNQRITKFILNPYNNLEVCTLEGIEFEWNRIQLDHLNTEEYSETIKILKRFEKLFFREGDQLTSTMNVQHEIRTVTDEQINAKLYRYPPQHEVEVRRQIKEMEEQGIIRKSNSRYSSPLIVVPKKVDNSGQRKYRIVVDYRKLNDVTIDDKYPLPNIDSILDKLGRAQYFTTIDLAKGYHQILIREQDREKTAFVTPHGLYEFIRMPFGLKNAPATFQRLMNETLRNFINKTCVVYLDDILVFSTSLREHVKSITDIFTVLEQTNLKIQIDKCNFMKKETEFLGHILTKEGLKPNPNKIKVIQSLEIPKTEKQIKSFLGLTGYYRKFVKDYAKVAQPITKYLKKDIKINTNDPSYIEAFEKLKTLISSHPILRYPNFEKQFTLTTDASNYAIGAVLSQEGHPVCFASRTLNNHERNYSATDKEFLAILWSVNYLRPYLYGRKFKILTDHQPIKFLHSKYKGKDMSPRHQRWLLKLGEYDFNIEYIKGKENQVADFLSRIENNVDVIQEKGECEASSTTNFSQNSENESDSNLVNNIENDDASMITIHSAEENLQDHFYIKEEIVNKYKTQIILTNNKVEEVKIVHGKRIIFIAETDFDVMGEIFRKYIAKGKIGIFSELSEHNYNIVQEKLIEMFSNDKQINFTKCTIRAQDIETEVEAVKQISLYHIRESMHSGIIETYNQIKHKIYYPKLMELIQLVINQCEICREVKYDRNPIKLKFSYTEIPSTKNEIIHLDTYVMRGHIFLTVIDKFSKFGAAYPLNDRNHLTIIEQLEDHFAKIGKPQKIIADNEFKATRIKEFLCNENINLHLTKPNSHTGNADIERLHNTIAEKFRILHKINKNIPIKQQIQRAVRNYNERYHSAIKCTPNEVQQGKIDEDKIRKNLEENKKKIIDKVNNCREDYKEKRQEGFIKNYKALRHKEQPKYKKAKLENVHPCNIKRPLKFSDMDNNDNSDMDTTD